MEGNEWVCVAVLEDDVKGELAYCMLRDVIVIEGDCIPVYGISVSFTSSAGVEFAKVHNISESPAAISDLMGRMVRGMVFPMSLMEVVEDFIA